MATRPAVSAVIPVHNGQAYVGQAIRSVLEQSLAPVECIVVDDGSTDATQDVTREFGGDIRYVRQGQSGVSLARNHGAEIARGDLVAFLDHDDLWLATKLERQVDALVSDGGNMAVCAMAVIGQGAGEDAVLRLRARNDLLTGMLTFDGTQTVSCSSTGVMRRVEFLAGGGFDPMLSTSADWDLTVRTLLHGGIVYVDEPLVLYRVHDANMSRNIGLMERDMRYALRKVFEDPDFPHALRSLRRHSRSRLYRMLAGSYRDAGETRAAVRTLTWALCLEPKLALDLFGYARRRAHL